MKNLHLLPTNEPSSLVLDTVNNNLFITTTKYFGTNIMKFQNIYITSDEEIKEGDWFIDLELSYIKECTDIHDKNGLPISHNIIYPDITNIKKIILTTDEELIADGVQAIDDEFLEWFVKNPSCEEVKFYKDLIQVNQNNPVLKGSTALVESYKIIIPQEEPICWDCQGAISKEGICFCNKEEPKVLSKLEIAKNIAAIGIGKEKPKQQTLEEVAERILLNNKHKKTTIETMIEFAKWQQERMYSEIEVFNIIYKLFDNHASNYTDKAVNDFDENLKKQ